MSFENSFSARKAIKRRSATHANSAPPTHGLKPHGYLHKTATRFLKTSTQPCAMGVLRPMVCVLVATVAACAGNASCEQVDERPESQTWPGAELFTDGMVCRIQIEISPQDLEKLRKESRDFVRATVTEAGARYHDVAVHLKGSVGSFRPLDDKPGFTLDFARFNSTHRFHRLRRIHLNNSVEDPSFCNEQLGSELFRAAGIAAPRVGRAVVVLNERKLGLYVLKEGFTEDFLSCFFEKVGGNLYEPGEGHDVNQHLKRISIQAPAGDRTALKALADAALEPDLGRRWQRLESVLEVDQFIRFMALEVMICHRDGYCLARNNFRVYQDRGTGKMMFFPHGMDQLFGNADLPWQPHMAGLVALAVMETPEGKQRYAHCFESALKTLFKPEALTNRVDQIIAHLHSALSDSEFGAIKEQAGLVKNRVIARQHELELQLSQPKPTFLGFTNGFARVGGWIKADEPAGGQMDRGAGPGGVGCLHILVTSAATPSWRTKALLKPAHYRFEGKVRVSGVEPLSFGAHQGAGLRIGGQTRESVDLIGQSDWRMLTADFDVGEGRSEVELICELRAKAGEAWFDCASLRIVEAP